MKYDYYWRMDTDSFLTKPIAYDIFAFMHSHHLRYGWHTTQVRVTRHIFSLDLALFLSSPPPPLPISLSPTSLLLSLVLYLSNRLFLLGRRTEVLG